LPDDESSRLKAQVEALLFASPTPLTLKEIVSVLGAAAEEDVSEVIEELVREYDSPGRGVRIARVGGGLQICTKADFAPVVEKLFQERREVRLSKAALETVAIVAYRQPITKPEIEELRGVDVGGVLHTLLERGLIEIRGRSKAVGRPLLYGTSQYFLDYFGLNSLEDMPSMEELESLMNEA